MYDDYAPDDLPLETLQDAIQAFLHGETGMPFEDLARFAEPLFDLYALDLRAALGASRRARDAQELATLLAVLETARLFWAYFVLEEDEARRRLPDLQACLLGDAPSRAEERDFLQLLCTLEEKWYELAPDVRSGLGTPGFALPPFEMLLAGFAPGAGEGDAYDAEDGYGPDQMDAPDALALFARPVIERPDVLADPDAMDAALTRVDAYWSLAHAPAEERPSRLAALLKPYEKDPQESRRIEAEARMMLERFDALFPERGPGA